MEAVDSPHMSDTITMSGLLYPETDVSEMDSDSFGTFDTEQPIPTPISWTATKALRTPTSTYSRGFASNASSVTCMNYGNLQDSSERQLHSTVKATPLRDLLPDDQERPYMQCPLSTESQVDISNLSDSMNKENDSPQAAQVLSPASAFRLKRAVFESNAQAVKSPSRRQRARNVSVVNLNETPVSMTPVSSFVTSATEHVESVSPSEAIQNENIAEEPVPPVQPVVEPAVEAPSPVISAPSSPAAVAIALPVLDATHSCSPEVSKPAEEDEKEVVQFFDTSDVTDAATLEGKKEALLQAFEDSASVDTSADAAGEQRTARWVRMALLLLAAVILTVRFATSLSAQPSQLATSMPAQMAYSSYSGDLVVLESEEIDAVHEAVDAAPLSAYESSPDMEWVNTDASLSAEGSFSMSVRYDSPAALDALVQSGDVSAIVRYHMSSWQQRMQSLLQRYEVPRRTRKLRRAVRKMQREVQPIMQSVVTAVLNYNYPTNIEELQAELSVVQHKIALHSENMRNKALAARAAVYEKAPFLPVVESAIVRGAHSAQRGVLARLQQLHRVVQEHDLLPEVYVEM